MKNQLINCNNIVLLLNNKNNDNYLEFIKILERNNFIVSIFYENDFKEELINEILISLKDFYLISFTNTKETHDYILNAFKNKIIKRVYCGFNHNIIDINIPTLTLYGDEDKKYFSHKIAYKTFIKFKNNQNYKFICYPLHNHLIHLTKNNNQLDDEFIEDLLLFLNENKVKPKLAIFSENHLPFLNGVNILTDLLKKELEKNGVKVYVVTIKLHDVDYKNWEEKNIKLINGFRLPGKTAKIQALYMTLNFFGGLKQLRPMQLDYLYVQNEYSLSKIAMMLSKKDNLPLLYTYHTMWDVMFKSKFRWLSPLVIWVANTFLFKPIAKYSHIMTVPTKKVVKVWSEKGKTNNIINIASAIDLDKFKIADNDLDKVKEIRNKYNLNDDFVLGFVGRISYEKNIQEIIEYISKIKDEYPNVKYMIVGYGEAYNYLVKYASKLGVKDKIIFVGEVNNDEVKYFYSVFDAFCTPSTFETQGLTYTEAMCAKTPLLVRDDPCLDDVIENEKNGFKYTNIDEFKKYLSILMNDNNKKEEIIKASEITLNNYRKDVWAKKIYSLIKECKKVKDSNRKHQVDFKQILENKDL